MNKLFAILCGFCAGGIVNAQSTIYVNHAAHGLDNGTSWTNAYADLVDALAFAVAGDEVWIAQGTYTPATAPQRLSSAGFTITPSTAPKTRTFAVPAGVAIHGGFSGTEAALAERTLDATATVLSGDFNSNDVPATYLGYTENAAQVVFVAGTNNTNNLFDRLTISNGAGGVLQDYLQISSVINEFALGAGLYAATGNLSLKNCIIRDNRTQSDGGGLFASDIITLAISDSLFEHNQITDGLNMLFTGPEVVYKGGDRSCSSVFAFARCLHFDH